MKQALFVAVFLFAAMSLYAQQPSETKQNTSSGANESRDQKAEPYRFNLVVRETKDGKVINSRTYSWMAQVGEQKSESTIKVGDRIPVVSGSSISKNNTPLNIHDIEEYQYIDIGTNIRSTAQLEGDDMFLTMNIDLSNVLGGQSGAGSSLVNPPVVTQSRSETKPVLHIGKPTTIFSLDDPMTKGHIEAELTVTKLKE